MMFIYQNLKKLKISEKKRGESYEIYISMYIELIKFHILSKYLLNILHIYLVYTFVIFL